MSEERVASEFPYTAPHPHGLRKAHADDAAYDLSALRGGFMQPLERSLVKTGLRVAIPEGHAGLVLPRSGLAVKHGITVLNSPGLIDAGYRGDVGVVLYNTSPVLYSWVPGERIAQLLIIKLPDLAALWHPAGVFDEHYTSERGSNGFGSTGS